MAKKNNKSKKHSNNADIDNDVLRLSEQIQSIKEELKPLYPIDDLGKNINRIEKNITCLTERISGLEQFKENIDGLSKQNERLEQDVQKGNETNTQKSYSLKIGYRSLVFIGAYSLMLFVFALAAYFINNNTQVVMTLIIGGLSALLIFAVVIILFGYKTKDILVPKKNK